jgi:hypothetical protein
LKCPPRPSTLARGPERKKADEQWKVGQVCYLDSPVINIFHAALWIEIFNII